MHIDLEAPRHLAHQIQHDQAILRVHEDLAAVVATLDDVVRHVCQRETGKTGHGADLDRGDREGVSVIMKRRARADASSSQMHAA